MPYLKSRQFAATKAETPGGGPTAPSTRKELWEILKIGKRKLRSDWKAVMGLKIMSLRYNTE